MHQEEFIKTMRSLLGLQHYVALLLLLSDEDRAELLLLAEAWADEQRIADGHRPAFCAN